MHPVIEHIENHIGNIKHGWDITPDLCEPGSIRIVEITDSPSKGVNTYCSMGLSHMRDHELLVVVKASQAVAGRMILADAIQADCRDPVRCGNVLQAGDTSCYVTYPALHHEDPFVVSGANEKRLFFLIPLKPGEAKKFDGLGIAEVMSILAEADADLWDLDREAMWK